MRAGRRGGAQCSPPAAASALYGRDRADADRAVGEAEVGYRSIGSGRPVVFIQGLAGTIDGWPPSFLDSVAAAGHRVVVFDNEGVGRSTLRKGTLTIRRMAQDTARLIKALRLKRPDVVGWSMGGMIAQSFAVDSRSALRRLVLLATAPGDGKATLPDADALQLLASGDAAELLASLFPPDEIAARDRYVSDILRRLDFNGIAPPAVVTAQLGGVGEMDHGRRSGRGQGGAPEGARRSSAAASWTGCLPVANQRHLAELIPHARAGHLPRRRARLLLPARRRLRAAADRVPALIDSRAWCTPSPRWSSPSTSTSRPRCRSTSAAACSPCGPSLLGFVGLRGDDFPNEPAPRAGHGRLGRCSSPSRSQPR